MSLKHDFYVHLLDNNYHNFKILFFVCYFKNYIFYNYNIILKSPKNKDHAYGHLHAYDRVKEESNLDMK